MIGLRVYSAIVAAVINSLAVLIALAPAHAATQTTVPVTVPFPVESAPSTIHTAPSATHTAPAASPDAVPANILGRPGRPRIGLVLGGGGAKGFAHIGVIQELERLHIPVDVVAGTSMGAVVGSLYAGGRSSAQLTEVAHSIDWVTVFNDQIKRDNLSLRRKSDERNILLPYRLSFKDGKPILPKGVLGGQKLFMTLQSLLLPNRAIDNFDNMAIPYRAVATNIVTGRAVVLGEGDISTAVFASMAVPAGFPPVERDGLLLVDGGISDNVPVDVARAMGVDVVIVVNVGSPPMRRDQINNAINVFSQMQLLLGNEAVERQLASLKGRDVLISPDIEGLSTTSFDRVDLGITRGLVAAQAVSAQLSQLSVNDAEWAAYLAAKAQRVQNVPIIARTVTVDNSSSVPTKELDKMITTQPGSTINGQVMLKDIGKIYSLAEFNSVSYALDGGPGTNRDLIVHAVGDPTQSKYFQFGFLMGSSIGKSSTFELAVGYTDRNFMGTGAEWRGFAKVGTDVDLEVSLYKQWGQFFGETGAVARRFNSQVSNVSQTSTLGVLRYGQIYAALTGGYIFGNWGDIRIGARIGGVKEINGSVPTGLAPGWNQDVAWTAGFHVDTLDSLIFPTTGNFATIDYTQHGGALGGDIDLQQFEFYGNKPITFGRTTIVLGARFGTSEHDNANFIGSYKLGGLFNLSGYAFNSLIGEQAVLGRAIVFHRLGEDAPILNMPIYVGGSLELGNVYQSLDDISFDSLHASFSGFVAINTPIGPAYFAYGHSGGSNNALYLIIGRVF